MKDVEAALRQHSNAEKAAFFPKFFKSGPGEYGEGDKFLGVVVPDQRKIAGQYKQLPRGEIIKLLNSPWHECRLTALLILVKQYEQKGRTEQDQKEIVDFYLQQLDHVNNWDLVDCSAHKILGAWLIEKPAERRVLKKLRRSPDIWRKRVSVIATLPLIKSGSMEEILLAAEELLDHPHDLIHKAVGWMLREMGKVEPAALRGFLSQYASEMPRTMLRYAIEKLEPAERKSWLSK
ncbi:MAG TPA: DNA alkylation repair protein [Planctomycetaceae bacterium]|nr:DNA alkylation repair protein [Planctomycetaceae bacterium]